MSEGDLQHQTPTSVEATNQRLVLCGADQWEISGVKMINTNTDLSSPATVTIREIYKETIAM